MPTPPRSRDRLDDGHMTAEDFPLKDVLVSTEIACKQLSAPKAQSLRAEVTKCIKARGWSRFLFSGDWEFP